MKLKKVAALGLATAMAFSVTACSSKPAETTAAAEETTAAADAAETVKEAIEGKDPAEVKVGISIYQFADNFMTLYRNELQKYLVDELGLKAGLFAGFHNIDVILNFLKA